MATLVLTAVGAAIGGPIGAAIGSVVGQQIDQMIFRPKPKEGPRLQELRVQTSSYGSTIPKLFGTMRVAGTVIWSTDLIEKRTREGGKGRPRTTRYSYSASFAVLLSGRPILGVRRIWADGNLLRGAAGDWKHATGFRLHLGGADQPVDPLIAAVEGAAPAYRGSAYAVFENMPLEPFGNRIPSLTFEVDADAGPCAAGDILAALAQGVIDARGGQLLDGFAASGSSLGAMVETLAAVMPLRLVDGGTQLLLAGDDDPVASIAANDLVDGAEDLRRSSMDAPGEASLTYLDPARDYQAGLQRARRASGARAAARVELPAVVSADTAKALAARYLADRHAALAGRRIRCGWAQMPLSPGARVQTPDGARWRIAERKIARDGVIFDLLAEAGTPPRLGADPGRSVSPVDAPQGPTTLHLLDLPLLGDTLPDAPRLHVAAAGVSPGWRRASLLASVDDGASWTAIGDTAPPAIMGEAETRLSPSPEYLLDLANSVEVRLLHADMQLADADAGQLAAGANLALLGDELIQFGRAVPLGDTHWRLEQLLRGRRGTEASANTHAIGERFVLIEADALLAWDPPLTAAGGQVRLIATGVGDVGPVQKQARGVGAALRPLSPVQLRARRRSDGGFDLDWRRRSRLGWRWLDGVDAPLGEEREAYVLRILCGDGYERVIELGTPDVVYAAGDVAADRSRGGSVTVTVIQLGTHAVSRPATLDLSLD